MNQLVCELCGSTDIMKDGGVFVCQQCGCKYSLEEARKLMGMGTIDVSGSTVKIDRSSKLNNLYILARRAKETQNNKDAIRYYHDIQVEDPNSWEAAFYSVYFTAMDCKIGEIASAALSIGNCLDPVARLIQNYVPAEEQKKVYTEMLMQAVCAEMLLFTAARNTYLESNYSNAGNDFSQRGVACLTAMQSAIKVAHLTFKDYDLAMTLIDTAATCCNSNSLFSSVSRALRGLSNTVQNDRRNAENNRRKAEREERINAYWAEHAEEKQRYDARLGEIDAELAQLQAESNRYRNQADEVRKRLKERLPEEQRLDELKRQHLQLVSQKSQLGLFAGKQKRELQEKIDGLDQQKEKMNQAAKSQRKALEDEVDAKVAAIEAKRQPIAEQMQVLSREKKQITDELTKDR